MFPEPRTKNIPRPHPPQVTYGNTWVDEDFIYHNEIFARDPDVNDMFDLKLLEDANSFWNSEADAGGMLRWESGAMAMGSVPMPV